MAAPREVEATMEQHAQDVRAKAQRGALIRWGVIVVGLALLVAIVNVLTSGHFLTPGNLTNVLRQITYNAILGVGQTFVIITSGIDLSTGSMIQLSGVAMALFANAMPFDGFPLIVATVIVGLVVGCIAGYVNALPVVRLNLPPFITTLAMMLVARGLAFKLCGGVPVPLHSAAFQNIGIGYILAGPLGAIGLPGIPIAVLWMAVIAILLRTVLARTRFGRYVYAIGGNEEAARLAGINVARTKTLVYVICSCCAAMAGLLLMARFSSGSPQTGGGDELLQSIAAVVVGGTSLTGGRGTIVGTFFGALLIGVLNNVMNLLNIESYTQEIVLGAVILLAVVLDELRKRYLTK